LPPTYRRPNSSKIDRLKRDDRDGILVQSPLPISGLNTAAAHLAGEGCRWLHPVNVGKLLTGGRTLSVHAAGVQELLVRYGVSTTERTS
jgi:5,10-methylene-tetrahydrofolate dehydrogenase/methenyl tetrahydrofolate cyclohydrolase